MPRVVFLTPPARFRVPESDGEVFIDPPVDAVSELLAKAANFSLPGRPIAGLSLAEFRRSARREVAGLIGIPNDGSAWFVAGHQPEFFHPGVWLKNFVLSQLAKQRGAVSLNLIVDNDVPKSAAVSLPEWRPEMPADQVRVATIPFDTVAPKDVPFEEWHTRDASLRKAFAARLAEETKAWPFRPIGTRAIKEYWESSKRAQNEELAVAARRHIENSWEVDNRELLVSRLSDTSAFAQFAETILRRAGEFQQRYNTSLMEYRIRNGIRSRHHPVAELITDGEWIETPFWCWTMDRPERRRAFVRIDGQTIWLRGGDADERWPHAHVKLRPRALTLTMFARMALADVFLHGIGGGKYDELTDAIGHSFFAAAPPSYMVVSGTLRLGLPLFPAAKADRERASRRERDLRWNPQRLLDVPNLAAERALLLQLPTANKSERRVRARRLRENLSKWPIGEALQITAAERNRIHDELRANEILGDRDYPWILYPEEKLRHFLQSALLDR